MRNLLLQTAVLFFSVASFAQLYVKPNGATDTYVYVNDEVLFVEQDVNLVKNNLAATKASIYLRNQSQLIQGATSSANVGNGFISVFQNSPNDDAYDYSYWCSPVGFQTLVGSGNADFQISRIFDSIANYTESNPAAFTSGHIGWTSPLTISTRWLYKRESGLGFTGVGNGGKIAAGLGFTMKGTETSNHNQLYDFRGRPNNGNISVPVINGSVVLSGNPYPSALDLNRFFHDPDNAEITTFRYWDEDRTIDSHLYIDNKGGYGTYVPGPNDPNGTTENGFYTAPTFMNYDGEGNPIGSTPNSGLNYARRFAPIGQGFMIYTNEGSSGTVVFKNSHRRYIKEGAANASIYRTSEGDTGTTESSLDDSGVVVVPPVDNRIPQLRLNAFFGESHYRDMLLAFYDDATDGYDRGLDGTHPMDGTIAEAYFPVAMGQDTNMVPFVISTVPYNAGKRIPITFYLEQPFDVKLIAVEEINLPMTNAYLWDRTTGTYYQITGGESANISLPAGEYSNRFFIVFRGGRDAEEGANTEENSDIIAENIQPEKSVDFFQNNAAAQLEVRNPDGYDIKTANVFDMTGKLVISQQNLGKVEYFTFPTANLSDGVYLVKLTTMDNINIDYKITIHNKR